MTLIGGLQTSALNGREERGVCERSLAKGVFHSEALKSSGSWAGAKALNSSEIPFLAARMVEFRLAQKWLHVTF